MLISILTYFSPTQVTVQVEDVNETPQFPPETYKASVFSIAPYRTPVIQVKVNTPSLCQFPFTGKYLPHFNKRQL